MHYYFSNCREKRDSEKRKVDNGESMIPSSMSICSCQPKDGFDCSIDGALDNIDISENSLEKSSNFNETLPNPSCEECSGNNILS